VIAALAPVQAGPEQRPGPPRSSRRSRSGPRDMRPACAGPTVTPKLTHLSAGLAEIAILYQDKVKRRFVRTN
jgi:hypothetical protein